LKLIAYVIDGHRIDIRPAPLERSWMEATGQRFAYRCLPLNIANAFGWEILCGSGFSAMWDGGPGIEAIQVHPDSGTQAPAVSHFAHGVLTFHIACIFRTEPGYDLMAQGPINCPKDGISPLAGIIETDWAPYTFTTNWIFTRPGHRVRFEKGEPFCHIFSIRRGELETVDPQLRPLSEDAELKRQFDVWQASRRKFNTDLNETGSQAQSMRWQKMYYRGLDPEGRPTGAEDHRTRVRLRPFSSDDRNDRSRGLRRG
jgi:Family of unknown function (DUF6065)